MPKTTIWDVTHWRHILLRPGPDQKVAIIEVAYDIGDSTDSTVKREGRIDMDRTHPLLAKAIAQALAATTPRLTVVDALVALLVADIKAQEGL